MQLQTIRNCFEKQKVFVYSSARFIENRELEVGTRAPRACGIQSKPMRLGFFEPPVDKWTRWRETANDFSTIWNGSYHVIQVYHYIPRYIDRIRETKIARRHRHQAGVP